jgi:DedD protein
MDKKATRRIIGVLVVVALVIILLPLFNSNDSQSNVQTAEIKAPPFPEAQGQTDTTTAQNEETTPSRSWFSKVTSAKEDASAARSAKPIMVAENNIAPAPQAAVTPNQNANTGTITPPKQDTMIANSSIDGEEEIEQDTSGAINNVTVNTTDGPITTGPATTAKPPQSTAPTPPQTTQATPQTPVTIPSQAAAAPSTIAPPPGTASKPLPAPNTAAKKPEPAKTPLTTAAAKPVKPAIPVPAIPVKTVAQTSVVKTQPDLNQLKKIAWVVQMGSFKSKLNAERLTNSLRAKGYKAFTFETKSNGQTRVYIGPEFKQVSAVMVASRIQSDMKMHGIVVSYKPLEL